MDATTIVTRFFRTMTTGDVHATVYDFGAEKTYLATGTPNADGTVFTRLACDAPFLVFENQVLWDERRP